MSTRTLIEAEALRGTARRSAAANLRLPLRSRAPGRRPRAHTWTSTCPARFMRTSNRDLAAPATTTSGRHPLPSPRDVRGAAARLGRGRRLATSSPTTTATACTPRGCGGCCAGSATTSVAVLDGGMRRWLAARPAARRRSARPGAAAISSRGRGRRCAVDAAAVLRRGTRPRRARILDARAPERYRGEVEPIDAVAGPRARRAQPSVRRSASTRDGRFLPPDELRDVAAARASTASPPARTIAMCGSGVTACHLLLALEHAGLAGARLYPGSWSEWSSDPARPVRTGESP
ncbi:MAG: hypothetical protein MZV70_43010 [Desulfobacterales bacterium]|nr:hypothetical protein [Desulfobacterales bacterium]